MNICEKHVAEPSIKCYIQSLGSNKDCSICGCSDKCVDTGSPEFHELLKAILRYNYDEVQYNSHFGGGSSTEFMLAEGFIFNKEMFASLSDEQLMELDNDIYNIPVYDGINIYAGYTDGQQNMLLTSIQNSRHKFFDTLSNNLATKNYHDFEEQVRSIISSFGNSFAKIVEGSSIVYRARIGVDGIRIALEPFNKNGKKFYVPFEGQKIGPVPPLKATNGRANRTGVSYLYCATDEYTAVAEIRPHPTDVVSVAQFSISRALKIFDFSQPNFLDFYESDDALDSMIPFAKMAEFYNSATSPSLEGRYLVTQLISECIRMEGYDGIKFKSTVGSGVNLVIFKGGDASYVSSTTKVYEINEVKYSYIEKPIVGKDDEGETYLDEI